MLFGAGAGRSRAFIGRAGAESFHPEPKKISGAGAEEKWLGSATRLHACFDLLYKFDYLDVQYGVLYACLLNVEKLFDFYLI